MILKHIIQRSIDYFLSKNLQKVIGNLSKIYIGNTFFVELPRYCHHFSSLISKKMQFLALNFGVHTHKALIINE